MSALLERVIIHVIIIIIDPVFFNQKQRQRIGTGGSSWYELNKDFLWVIKPLITAHKIKFFNDWSYPNPNKYASMM